MVVNRNWRADESVGIKTLGIRERNEHFAKHLSIGLSQNTDTSNASWIAAIFDRTRFHKREPIRHRVKPPNRRPYFLRRRINDAAHKNARHILIMINSADILTTNSHVANDLLPFTDIGESVWQRDR